MRRDRQRTAAALFAITVVSAGCGGPQPQHAAPSVVPDDTVAQSLLSVGDINAVMGTASIAPGPVAFEMADNRNLLPNRNCLGVWQVDEAAIYGESGKGAWTLVRRQTLREPDTDQWQRLAVQSVVSFPTEQAAQEFFDASADRWAKCVNHHVNITLNDQRLPKWLSGDLVRSEHRLTMPIARGVGAESRSCQHVLDVLSNVVIDVEACVPPTPAMTQGAVLADRIGAALA